ncbi:MAG: hypothetical protein LIO56_01155 [Lachnospiraceae bacterium]|nr:hypothetical protein [Lachnospiraceae bacterium]
MSKKTFYCGKCGQPLPENPDAAFCTECGAEIPLTVRRMRSETEDEDEPTADLDSVSDTEPEEIEPDESDSEEIEPDEPFSEEKEQDDTEPEEIEPDEADSEEIQSDETDSEEMTSEEPKSRRRKRAYITLGIIAAIVAVIIIWAVVVVFRTKTVSLDDYITVETEGYNGYGEAECIFDTDAFMADYGNKIWLRSHIALPEDVSKPADLLLDYCIGYEIDFSGSGVSDGALTNGDTLTVIWDGDDELAESDFRVMLEHSDLTFEVEGLADLEPIDAFSEIEVEFSGTAPKGEARIVAVSEEPDIPISNFSLSEQTDLSNGDTVTVTLADEAAESLRKDSGRTPETMEQEYTVEGLDSCITQIADIPEDTVDSLKQKAEEVIGAGVVQTPVDGVSVTGLEYQGCYLISEDTEDGGYTNRLYMVYKVNAEAKITAASVDETFSFYTYVRFQDVILKADGSCSVNPDDNALCSNTFTRQFGQAAKTTTRGNSRAAQQASTQVTGEYCGYESLDQLMENIENPDAVTDTTIQADEG